jgi:hypothetical protein
MKKIEITIKGKSQFAYVAFYNSEILSKLNEIAKGEFDILDFIQEYSKHDEKYETVLGQGFCMEHDPVIKVCDGDDELYNGKIYPTYYDGDMSKMKIGLKEEYGVEYDDVISNGVEEMLGVDSCFF